MIKAMAMNSRRSASRAAHATNSYNARRTPSHLPALIFSSVPSHDLHGLPIQSLSLLHHSNPLIVSNALEAFDLLDTLDSLGTFANLTRRRNLIIRPVIFNLSRPEEGLIR